MFYYPYSISLNISQLILFCSDVLFQPKAILLLNNHQRKFFIINIKISQCFKYYFFTLFSEKFWYPITVKKNQTDPIICYLSKCTNVIEQIKTTMLGSVKIIRFFSGQPSAGIYLLSMLLIFTLSLISTIKISFISLILFSMNCRGLSDLVSHRCVYSCFYFISKRNNLE